MPQRKDMNELAAHIVRVAAGDEGPPAPTKDPAAVSLGRRGGKKGGPARAKALSKRRRRAIAKKAAAARWGSPKRRAPR